ncbi:MAG: FHA domain-containing protein [Sandaracinaceae bacterium]
MDCWIEIIREDGTLERQRIEGERVTLGRSPSAGVPIPDARDLEPEHLMIAPRADGCWVAVAQGARVGATVRGQPFEHGMVAWGAEIEIANLKLRVTDRLPKEKKEKGDKPVSAPILIAFFVIVPLVGWLLLGGDGASIDTTPAAPPPELFDTAVACPTSGGNTRHHADRDAEAAIAKSERYPFSSQDGVDAVHLYMRSQSCYAALGAESAADAMEGEADLMRRRVEEDYRHHRLRLQRSLEQGRLPDALLETRALIELVRHRTDDPYLAWLRQLARQLQLAIDAAV